MIFISHRQADHRTAVAISEFLKARGVQTWVDVLDPVTRNGAIDITDHIVQMLDKCSHVIVVFSTNTAGSMWVPFELGAAYKADKGIGTYLMDSVPTPEYLNAFPRMRTSVDLEHYLAEYKSDQNLAKSRSDGKAFTLDTAGGAASFIRKMKYRLGQ